MNTPADHDKRCPAAWDTSVKCNCGAHAADEIALIEKTLESVGITSLLNHGLVWDSGKGDATAFADMVIETSADKGVFTSLLNHGAASCVFTEGCCDVSQEHILAYTRKIALHCAVALAAPPTAQAEGRRLVPVEPTAEMLRAGDQKTWVLPALECWRAMLAAAPNPPTSAEGVEHV